MRYTSITITHTSTILRGFRGRHRPVLGSRITPIRLADKAILTKPQKVIDKS